MHPPSQVYQGEVFPLSGMMLRLYDVSSGVSCQGLLSLRPNASVLLCVN